MEIDTDIFDIISVEPFPDFEEREIEWGSPEHEELLRIEEEARVRYRTSSLRKREETEIRTRDAKQPRSDWKVVPAAPPYRLKTIKW